MLAVLRLRINTPCGPRCRSTSALIHTASMITLRPGPAGSITRSKLSQQGLKRLDIKAAGLNHFTWVLSIHDKESGADLYPLFRERLRALDPHVAPLSRELFEIFGLFPVPGDDHLAEYLPWLHDPQTKPWENYGIELYAWDEAEASREAMWDAVESMAMLG